MQRLDGERPVARLLLALNLGLGLGHRNPPVVAFLALPEPSGSPRWTKATRGNFRAWLN
jgi:hypothetical protein